MTRAIPLEGLPDKYEPDAVANTIRTSLGVVEQHLEELGQVRPSSANLSTRAARFADVRTIALRFQDGAYGSAADPRVALPTVDGSGMSADGWTQRFRFDVGSELRPLLRFHVRDTGWVHMHAAGYSALAGVPLISFGQLVTGIRHDLGRIPEFCIRRASSSRFGPVGQRVSTNGGNALVPVGTRVRCQVDFMPLFGISTQDIELQLKGLLQFTTADHGFDDLGGLLPDASFFENPALLKGYASDLVTTEDRFGGLLVATTWGLPTFQAIAAGAVPAANQAGFESSQSWTRDPVNGNLLDQNATCAIREFGSLFGMRLPGSGNLAALQTAGLKISLARGSVDFVLE